MDFLKRNFPKRECLFFAVLCFFLLIVWDRAGAEEAEAPEPTSTYEVLTKDYEAGDIEHVRVNQIMTSVSVVWYTMAEIDGYIVIQEQRIEMWEWQIKAGRENIEKLKEMRQEVEIEAKKVKLKKEGELGS